jgi:ATP-dependent Clp protease ATP-binding subunit ClpA
VESAGSRLTRVCKKMFTPRALQAFGLARKEADRLKHNYIGTEHLLLGLIKLDSGVAVNLLKNLGLNLETVRLEVEKQCGFGAGENVSGLAIIDTDLSTPLTRRPIILVSSR